MGVPSPRRRWWRRVRVSYTPGAASFTHLVHPGRPRLLRGLERVMDPDEEQQQDAQEDDAQGRQELPGLARWR
jgi:hypothetical protein